MGCEQTTPYRRLESFQIKSYPVQHGRGGECRPSATSSARFRPIKMLPSDARFISRTANRTAASTGFRGAGTWQVGPLLLLIRLHSAVTPSRSELPLQLPGHLGRLLIKLPPPRSQKGVKKPQPTRGRHHTHPHPSRGSSALLP